ncbi:MAG: hypothetical protein QNK37_18065 [Acidobacteriota bacterium]|nr:hypothetical protein [Acidobacteriota bacterium]
MGRQNKVNHLFKGLRKKKDYTVAEIVERAERLQILEMVYPDTETPSRIRKAKQLVQSHINARGIQSRGRRNDMKVYAGSNFVNHEDAMDEWAEKIRNAAMARFAGRFRVWAPALAAVFIMIFTGMFWIYPQPDGPLAQVRALEKAGDVDGLRAFDRINRKVIPVITESEAAELVAHVQRVLGHNLNLKVNIDTYDHHPFRESVAASVSRLDTEIHVIDLEKLRAVFPFLKDPTWVFADDQGRYFPVRLGTNIKLGGEVGYVTSIDSHSLGYRLQNGASRIYERPLATFFGAEETRQTKSVIFGTPEGNLDELIAFIGRELGKPVINEAQFPGQVVGFFPPVTDLADLFAELIEIGVEYDGETIRIDVEPEIKVHIGFYQDRIMWSMDLNVLFEKFDALVPQRLERPAFSQERYWYFGQSFYDVCRQIGILPRIDGASISLVR